MTEITQQFGFDAAHSLEAGAPENRRIHGHSFYVDVMLRGEIDPSTGMVQDFDEVKATLAEIATELDHRLLNDLPDLGPPTLENIARFIFHRAKARLPAVASVCVSRPSYGQSCLYEGV